MKYLQACGRFLSEMRRDFQRTGALLPSSRFLARALAEPLRYPRPAWRILEVGPGTGAVTEEIIRLLRPHDRLDLVEINERFVRMLDERLRAEWRVYRPQIQLFHCPVEEMPGHSRYDLIVSGLPFNNFAPQQVRGVINVYRRLLVPGGILTYFEYSLVRQLKHPFATRKEKRRLYRVGRIMKELVRHCQIERKQVLANLPPAIVRRLRFGTVEAAE
ncbi:MAG: translation initiation factor IF-2 [Gemmataceae bacterium]